MIAALLTAAPVLAMLATAAPATAGRPPINLVVKQDRGMLRLTVLGLSDRPYAAYYALEVDGQGPAGRNRTTQGGKAALRTGEPAVLLSVALAGGGAARWTATLTVTPADGAPYRQQRASPPAER